MILSPKPLCAFLTFPSTEIALETFAFVAGGPYWSRYTVSTLEILSLAFTEQRHQLQT